MTVALAIQRLLETPSFVELLRRESPHLVAGPRSDADRRILRARARHDRPVGPLSYGVIMGGRPPGDAGYQVASRRIEKIFKSDRALGRRDRRRRRPAMEMAKLFQTELEHYEEGGGRNLSLEARPTASAR